MSSLRTKILKAAAWTVVGRLIDRGIGLLSTLVLVRLLSPQDFGVIAMGLAFAALISAVLDISFTQTLIQRESIDRRDYDTAFTLNIVLSTFAACAILALIPLAQRFYGDSNVGIVLGGIAAVAFIGGFRNFGMALHERALRFGPILGVLVGRRLAGLVITVSCALYWQNFWALLAGMAGGAFVEMLMGHLLSPQRPRFDLSRSRELLSFSGWLILNNLITALSMRGQDFLIGRWLGAARLGSYSVANELATLCTSEVVLPVVRAAYPGYVQIRDDRARLAQGLLAVFSLISLLLLPAVVGMIAVADPAVRTILTDKWVDSIPLLKVLSVLALLQSMLFVMQPIFLALGRPRRVAGISLVYVCIGLPTMAFMLGSMPLERAVLGLIVGAAAALAVGVGLVCRDLSLPPESVLKVFVRPAIAAALMALALHGWTLIAPPVVVGWPLAQLVTSVLVGMVAYTIAIGLLWRLNIGPGGAEGLIVEMVRAKLRRRT
jgi:lipopolysaccharide exporter